jgi:hypothetical protein
MNLEEAGTASGKEFHVILRRYYPGCLAPPRLSKGGPDSSWAECCIYRLTSDTGNPKEFACSTIRPVITRQIVA